MRRILLLVAASASLAALAQDRAGCTRPELQPVAMPGRVSPGDGFTVKGCGFGDAPGAAKLKGKFGAGFLKLDVLSWRASQVDVRVPAGTVGAPDQDAVVVIENAAGIPSAGTRTIAFRATRDTRLLTRPDFDFACAPHTAAYGATHCGTLGESGNYGVCAASVCYGQKLFPSPDANAFANLERHRTLQVPLKALQNGWVVKAHAFESNSGADFFVPPIPAPERPALVGGSDGAASTTFVVKATNNAPTGWYWWKLTVKAEGPKGVPHDRPWSP